MPPRVVGVAMNGVTGRMGYNQHLVRSVLAIRAQGGVMLADGTRLQVEPVLVGRDETRLAEIARKHDIRRWTTDLDVVLSDPDVEVYFDAQVTAARYDSVRAAIAAGKHVYAEKPVAESVEQVLELAQLADARRVVHGVVHDKLYLPGVRKLRRLLDGGFFGRVLSVRGEFGYWVFEGDWQPSQRPSWNYRARDGGGIVADMFSHWSYVLEYLFGPVRSVAAEVAVHLPERVDEAGKEYEVTAEDAAYAIMRLENGVIAQMNSSWCVRVHRKELLELQVDGVRGSAVAGLHGCVVQPREITPRAIWNPDLPPGDAYLEQWCEVPDNDDFGNAFKVQWEEFLCNVASGTLHLYDFHSGARGARLAFCVAEAARTGRRVVLSEA